jgi:hypothetical protein
MEVSKLLQGHKAMVSDNLLKGIEKFLKENKIKSIQETDQDLDFVKVDSSAISSIEYDYIAQILHVTFTSGQTYGYAGVSENVVNDWINSSSIGATFVQEIRNNYIYWRM